MRTFQCVPHNFQDFKFGFQSQEKLSFCHILSVSWSRAVGHESPYHGSRPECLSRMLVIDVL